MVAIRTVILQLLLPRMSKYEREKQMC